MSEMKEMILDVVEKIFKDKVDKEKVDVVEEGGWAEDVWSILQDNELLSVAVSEQAGGAGGDLDDLFNLYRLVGKYAVPVPFLETTFANYVLEHSNLNVTSANVTYSIDLNQPLIIKNGLVSGKIMNVPWARHTDELVALATSDEGMKLVHLNLSEATIQPNMNLACEPRDTVSFEDATTQQEAEMSDTQVTHLLQLDTATKVALMGGAIDKINQLTVRYTKEREQFGRPIHRFQLIQQHLVLLAGETAIVNSAVDNLIAALLENRLQNEVAYARIRVEEAIKIVATSAHQVFGAIGVTHEHSLHQFTRRLWAWRDEGPGEVYWSNQLAKELLASSSESLWAYLTSTEKVLQV